MREKVAARDRLPEDLAAWKNDLRALWLRVWIVANKALALSCAVVIHKFLDIAGEWLIPVGWERCSKVFRGTFFAVFMVIYLHFLWEMLIVFVPSLRSMRWRKTEERT
jgi:hypothetical protein